MARGNCLKHTSVPAKINCHHCHHPVCSECIEETSLGQFCSADCAKKFAQFQEKWGKSGRSGGLAKLANQLVGLVVIAIVVIGAIHAAVRFGGVKALAPFDLVGKYIFK